MSHPEKIVAHPSDGDAPLGSYHAGFIRLDNAFGIEFLDEQAGRLLGFSAETLLGRRFDELADLANLSNLIKNGISFRSQIIVVGSRRIVCDYVPIVEDDVGVGGLLSLLRVLSEDSENSSDELAETLRSANAFMNFDHDGIIVVDRNGIVVLVNQAFAKMFDSTPQAMIGKHIDKAYVNSQPSRLPTVMETGKAEVGITHYFNGKQVYASRFPLIKDGKIIGCMGKVLFNDVREISRIATQLRAASETPEMRRNVMGKQSLFKYDVNSIVGQSRKMAELKGTLLRVARKNSNVLLLGESGTGKELFAHAIHAASTRRYAPFVKINCAAIPEHLLESELFGYTEGAFTGAKRGGQIGKFELAHTGTIFLDEIGDMPVYMQAKMLRVLQEKELTQLGGMAPKPVDVRVVAATNSNLEELVRVGKFREDLYYRLKVVTLPIPPLRERMEDLPAITANFIDQFNSEFGLHIQGLDPEAHAIIMRYNWPGNIRELRNVIESAFNVVSGTLIRREHLPELLTPPNPRFGNRVEGASPQGIDDYIESRIGQEGLNGIMDDFERELLRVAIKLSRGNKLQAAQLLGISRQWLYRKLQKHSPKEGGSD